MEKAKQKRMRRKQFFAINGLILTLLSIYFLLLNVLEITYAQFFLVLGVIILIQAVLGLSKGDSTKSLIPIFEQVAHYEKQKMGREWNKQRKVGYIWNLILSSFMFLQFYLYRDSSDDVFQIDFSFMLIMMVLVVVLINVSLILHIRKVDRSTSPVDLKGYTWKANLTGVVVGVVFSLVIIALTILYISNHLEF